jgi:N utilization substance protein A
VEWSPDMGTFVANALSPAKVVDVNLEEGSNGKTATVVVPNKQLSLAIGKEGQNARLAAKLTGWRIDIKSVSEMAEEAQRKREAARIAAESIEKDLLAAAEAILLGKPEAAAFMAKSLETLDLSKRVYNCLTKAGITDLKQLLEKLNQGDEEMLAIPGFGPKSLAEVKEKLQIASLALTETVREEEPEPTEEVSPLAETELAEEALIEEAIVVEAEEEAEPAPVLVEEVPEEEEVEVVEPEADADEAAGAPSEEPPETIEAEPEEEVLEFAEEEEEEEEELVDKPKKKRKDPRKRTLVYDEEMGEVIAKRRRKPSRRVEDWEKY